MSTPSKTFTRRRYPIAAGKTIAAGDSVGIITGGGTSSGYAQSFAAVTTLASKGVAQAFYTSSGRKLGPATSPVGGVNTAGSDGDQYVEVEIGLSHDGGRVSHRRKNDTAGTPLTQASVGSDCYGLNGDTATGSSSGNSVLGKLDEINPDGTVQVLFPL